ncbi:MAG TPA: hypothetical protein VGL75_02355 [Acidothermaceae bacterium]|jgi:hypothetical protein
MPRALISDDIEQVVVASAYVRDVHRSVHGQRKPLFIFSVVISNDLGRRFARVDLT